MYLLHSSSFGQDSCENGSVLPSHRGALSEVLCEGEASARVFRKSATTYRQSRMARISEQDNLVVDPRRKRQVDPERPFHKFVAGCQGEELRQAYQRRNLAAKGVQHTLRTTGAYAENLLTIVALEALFVQSSAIAIPVRCVVTML